jgi:hypothetical protein
VQIETDRKRDLKDGSRSKEEAVREADIIGCSGVEPHMHQAKM